MSPPTTALPAQKVPAGFEPTSASFVTATDGWALGTVPCSGGRCPALAATTTAGWSWTLDGVPPAGSVGVRFADREVGYAWGANFSSVTTDGGRPWGAPLHESSVTAAPVWGDDPLVADSGHLYESGPAGVGTREVSPADLGPVDDIEGDRQGGGRGWACALGSPPDRGMLETSDDGTTWTVRPLPCTPAPGHSWQQVDFTRSALPPACSAGQLEVGQAGRTAAGLGNTAMPFRIENASSSVCSIPAGYPGVTLSDSSGASIPVAYDRGPSGYIIGARDVEPEVLQPRQAATFFLSGTDQPAEGQNACPAAVRITVYPPGGTVAVSGPADLSPCRGRLGVSPIGLDEQP